MPPCWEHKTKYLKIWNIAKKILRNVQVFTVYLVKFKLIKKIITKLYNNNIETSVAHHVEPNSSVKNNGLFHFNTFFSDSGGLYELH